MGIAKNLLEIKVDFVVYGYINDTWEEFKERIDYQAFLLKKKN